MNKKVEQDWEKCFDQLSGARSTQKLVKIHNSQAFEMLYLKLFFIELSLF